MWIKVEIKLEKELFISNYNLNKNKVKQNEFI